MAHRVRAIHGDIGIAATGREPEIGRITDVLSAPSAREAVDSAVVGLTLILEGQRLIAVGRPVSRAIPAPQVHTSGNTTDRDHVGRSLRIDAVAGLHALDDERQRAQTGRRRRQQRQAQALVRAERSAAGPNERWNGLSTRTVVLIGRVLSEKCPGNERQRAYDNGQRPEFGHGFSPCGGWIPLASAAAQDRTPARRPALARSGRISYAMESPVARLRSPRYARGVQLQTARKPGCGLGFSVACLVLEPLRRSGSATRRSTPGIATDRAPSRVMRQRHSICFGRDLPGRNSRGRTRTCDPPVNSRLLYQLSYSGRATLSAFSRQLSASRGGNIVRATRHFNRRDLADRRRPTADGSTAAPRAPYLPRSGDRPPTG